jgi:hypothetical protein
MDLLPKGEGSSFTVAFNFTNYIDELTTMLGVKFRIDCLTNKVTVREGTVTPEAEMELAVTPSDNAIINDRNKRELKQLTLIANDDTETQFVDPDPIRWWVVNILPGRSISP